MSKIVPLFHGYSGYSGRSGVSGYSGRYSTAWVSLDEAGTIATNASIGNSFKIALTGSRILGKPTGAIDGQIIRWKITQDNQGNRQLDLASGFEIGPYGPTLTLSSSPHAVDFLSAIYDQSLDTFYIIGLVPEDGTTAASIGDDPVFNSVTIGGVGGPAWLPGSDDGMILSENANAFKIPFLATGGADEVVTVDDEGYLSSVALGIGTSGYSGVSGYSGYSGAATSGYSGYSGSPATTISLTEAPSDQSYAGTTVSMTYGESIVPGDLLYVKAADGKVYKADANGSATYPVMGLALETASSGSHLLLLDGIYRDDSRYSFTVGGSVYLSNTPGGETQTQPSATDEVIQKIGLATHSDRIYFRPEFTYGTHV